MSAPKDTVWELESHSLGKHRILKRYIDAWLPIMSKNNRRIILIDAFAGPGRYIGGEEGSPLILLNSFLNHSYRDRMRTEVVYLFIEQREDRYNHLRAEVGKLNLPSNISVHAYHGRYEDVFRKRLAELQEKGRELAPTFAFVDPFGYSEASMDLTGRFLQFRSCEVLIYMPLPFVTRFVTREGQEDAMNSLFGTDQWKEAATLSGEDRRNFLHDLFRSQLRTNGSRYVRSFEIQAGSRRGYHLFFGTNNELGLERMKEAMWSVDPVAGQRFADSTALDQLVLFEATPDFGPLRQAVERRFAARLFGIEEAEHFVLLETPYVPSQLRKAVLVPAETEGRLKVLTDRKRVRSYPPGTRMRFVQHAEKLR